MKYSVGRDTILTILGLATMVVAFVFIVYLPGKKSCDEINQKIAAASKQIEGIPWKVAELDSLHGDIRRHEEFLRDNVRRFPDQADLHNVIRDIADLARAANLEVTQLKPQKAVIHESYEIIPFELTITGRFFGVAQFLHGIESRERLFSFQEFSLNSDTKRNPGVVEGEMYFSVYIRRAEISDSNENNDSAVQLRADRRRR